MAQPEPKVKYTVYGGGFNSQHIPNAPSATENYAIVKVDGHGHGFALGSHPVEDAWERPAATQANKTLARCVEDELYALGLDKPNINILRIGPQQQEGPSDTVLYIKVPHQETTPSRADRLMEGLRKTVYPAVLGILERAGFKDVGVHMLFSGL
ncbi:hypothetical protein CMUS01_04901 [Colletotrichum musicola]|uniref:Uncharacterized protein n=1 Tax=Colletotrichum musicola TaxID=2175873 RepID=A0A8H6KVR4_9PEZI|nr:hypothetical protein CMUS01_04901 [Colletotrichum musicola]